MHQFTFKTIRGQAKTLETKYLRAIEDCQRIVRRYYAEFGGISGYTAHTPIGAYGGVLVNGRKGIDDGDAFALREHFAQNLETDFVTTCETNNEPYDLVVTACLAVLKHRLGNAIEINSHADTKAWSYGVNYARKVTGLKLINPIQD